MNKIRVDFNSLGRGGMVRASVRRADQAPTPGERVVAVDPDEGMEFAATVESVDQVTGSVWLVVEWEPAVGEPETAAVGPARTAAANGLRVVRASTTFEANSGETVGGRSELLVAG